MHARKLLHQSDGSRLARVNNSYQADALCPLPPPDTKIVLICSFLQHHGIAKPKHEPGNTLSFNVMHTKNTQVTECTILLEEALLLQ